MSGLTKQDLDIIDGRLATQRGEILDKVSDIVGKLEQIVDHRMDRIMISIESLVKVASEAKGLASSTYHAIEGNGAIGMKTQVKNNSDKIDSIVKRLDCEEKEELIEKIEDKKQDKIIKIKKKSENKTLIVAVIITIIGSSAFTNLISSINSPKDKDIKKVVKEVIIEMEDINEFK